MELFGANKAIEVLGVSFASSTMGNSSQQVCYRNNELLGKWYHPANCARLEMCADNAVPLIFPIFP